MPRGVAKSLTRSELAAENSIMWRSNLRSPVLSVRKHNRGNRQMKYFMLLAALLLALASDNSTAANLFEIKFTSYKPTLRELLASDFKKQPVELSAKLYLPEGDGPFPALIWVHGSGGPDVEHQSGWINVLAKLTTQRRVALFVIDSYGGRHISGADVAQGRAGISMSVRIMDTFMAANALAKNARINPAKLYVSGHSAGGLVSINSASMDIIQAVKELGVTFAGHIPVSPECLTQPGNHAYNGKPMLIVSGENDEATPIKNCERLVVQMGAHYPVELKAIPNGNHTIIRIDSFKWTSVAYNSCGRWIFDERGGYTLPDMGGVNNGPGSDEFNKAFKSCTKFETYNERGSLKIRSELESHLTNYIDTFVLTK